MKNLKYKIKKTLEKDNFKSLNKEDKIIVFLGVLILALILIFNLHFFYNIFYPYQDYKPLNFNFNDTILIVAPHPDDESALFGSGFFEHNKSNIYIVYLTTGSFFSNHNLNKLYADERIKEAKKAMKKINIPEKNLFFLNYTDQKLLFQKENISSAKKQIEKIVLNVNPKIIIFSSYEGGHCIHDLTNIIMSSIKKDLEKNDKNNILFYEGAEYNEYYNLLTPRKTFSNFLKQLNINLNYPSLFLPEKTQKINITTKYYYNSSKKSLKEKRNLLKQYTTQNIEGSLKKKFYYRESLRLLPNYNYNNPPYNLKESFNYKICLLKNFYNKKECEKYSVCKIDFKTFNEKIKEAGLI